jgi:hypothetical protein
LWARVPVQVRLEKACRALQVERMERRERLKASQE